MAASGRELRVRFGGRGSSLLASSTLVAALSFTPWVIDAETPWAQFAFRAIGLTALGVVSLGKMRGALVGSRWATRATIGCMLLLAISGLSAAISVNQGKSLEAMLNLLAIAGLFLTAVVALRGKKFLRGVALLEILAAVPVAAVGIAQHFRPDLLPAGNSYPGRALGPFGQPNRLGGYLIVLIPLALALSFAMQDRALRLGLLLAVFVFTFCLVATYSRGAWIGLVLGLLALAVLIARWPELAPRPIWIGAALAALLAPAIFFLPTILSRIAPKPAAAPSWNLPIDPEREGSSAMRRAVWSGSLAAFAARPVLGWGIGAFREAYDRSKSDQLKRLEAVGGRTADQAHNFYLKALVERGVLGLAAFLAFVGLCTAAGLAALREGAPESRLLAAGLLASVAALLGHAALEDNLSLVPHGTLLFANLGLLVAVAPDSKDAPSRRARWAGAVGVLVALLGVGVSGMSASASTASREGAAAMAVGKHDEARSHFAEATRLAPWEDRYAAARARVAEASTRAGSGSVALREAESSYRRAIAMNGSDPVTRHELARLYLAHPAEFGPAGTASALRELRAALAQNPHYAEIRNDLGVALLVQGDRARASAEFRGAAEGRSDFVDPLLNLATLAREDGNIAEAERLVALALERNPGSARAVRMRESLAGQHGQKG
jgi:putative inorganic carbon (HCO3(-)) transporter